MTTEQQEKIYQQIEEATITSYSFDLFKNRIIFELRQDYTGERHTVIFKNVSAFSYAYDTGKLDELQLEEWDPVNGRLELTSIGFWTDKIKSSLSGATWASEYKLCYNVVIEMWYKTLFINATDITVDDETFKIDEKEQ